MKTTQPRMYLSPPHLGTFEMEYVREAFASNWVAPLGPNVDGFEGEMASYVGSQAALALCSGTAAVHLALKLVGVGEGDAVFCSSLTFIGSANPILYERAIPVFIDSEPASWNMSPVALERALQEAEQLGRLPRAVVVANLYGQSADYDPILSLCESFGVPIIEDAAESLGATYRGKKSGTLGRYSILSFNGNKIITTGGGGMLLSDDEEAISKARFWATQARDPAPHYEHTEIGYNYRMSNILAGIGRGQLRVLEERVEARRKVFSRYKEALGGREGVDFMPEAPFGRSNRWLSVMTIDPTKASLRPIDVIKALEVENIEARPVWKPMHRQPLFAGCRYYPHQPELSISDRLFAVGVCLPSGSNLIAEDQERVISAVLKTMSC